MILYFFCSFYFDDSGFLCYGYFGFVEGYCVLVIYGNRRIEARRYRCVSEVGFCFVIFRMVSTVRVVCGFKGEEIDDDVVGEFGVVAGFRRVFEVSGEGVGFGRFFFR